jgi:uncharacterized protein YxeA
MKKLILILLFCIISITKIFSYYADKPTKMVYYLKENESSREVAEKFHVKAENIKADGRYLMFYVR